MEELGIIIGLLLRQKGLGCRCNSRKWAGPICFRDAMFRAFLVFLLFAFAGVWLFIDLLPLLVCFGYHQRKM